MLRKIWILSFFVILNMALGRMFQESLGSTCFSELSILAITNLIFWSATASQIKKWGAHWNVGTNGKNLILHGGLGLSTSAINIFIGQGLVIFLMSLFYQCASPSFDMLQAGLTNNIAVNLMCYFALLFLVARPKENIPEKAPDTTCGPRIISATKNGVLFYLEPNDIFYIEASNNCVVLHTEKGKFVKYQSLKSIQNELPEKNFRRVHRSYLVNFEQVQSVLKNRSGDGILKLKTGHEVKFSRTYHGQIRS